MPRSSCWIEKPVEVCTIAPSAPECKSASMSSTRLPSAASAPAVWSAMVLAPQWEDESGELRRGLGGGFRPDVLVSVHDEAADWATAHAQARRHGLAVLCIPTGGAVVIRGSEVEAKLPFDGGAS